MTTWSFPEFYGIPKHKAILALRPIVPSFRFATTNLSIFVSIELNKTVACLPTVAKNADSVVADLLSLDLPSDCELLSADVEALYPSIPIDLGIQVVSAMLYEFYPREPNATSKKRTNRLALIDFLINGMTFILRNNMFTYDGTIYLQMQGTAMGSPFACAFANIFMFGLDCASLPVIVLYYKRYIDDVIAVVRKGLSSTSLKEIKVMNVPKLDDSSISYLVRPVQVCLQLCPWPQQTHDEYAQPALFWHHQVHA